jgi:class 3 adenylate cyclase/tetratricopeptide (TPR) repeat protein
MKSVAEWLTSLGLGEYSERFAQNAIDFSVVGDLTEQDLRDLGLPLGHRRRLLRAIAELHAAAMPDLDKNGVEPERREEAQRRQLTVMFCDLVGSSAISAELDPEDMRHVIGAYQGCVTKFIRRYDGIVARYIGDGVLAYFGYPQAHEDDAAQAVRAGLALVDAVAELETEFATALKVRIGIATGTVVVGDLLIGQTGARERAVVGETPNLASRLQTLGEPGTVVICSNTQRLTSELFELRDLGRVVLKGWSEPIAAWQVLSLAGVESLFEARHRTQLAPPLGRDEEIEILVRRWRQAVMGEGRVVVLTGEPGIGKSHIAIAIRESLDAGSLMTMQYVCSAHHSNSALFPFISQIERAAKFERGESTARKLSKLESLLARTSAEPRDVALLSSLLSLPLSAQDLLAETSPQQRKEATLAALVTHLAGLAAQQPLLLIFEDAHWSDPTSLELLTRMVELVPKLPVLLIVTARPEFKQPWPNDAHVTTLQLTRLDRRHGALLIERVAGGKALPDVVANEILVRTDGVPLFIEELTKTLLESGFLQERAGRYVLDRALPALAIPTTLQASLMARLDRLAPVREVAQIGAVVGREFSFELLHAVAGLPRGKLENTLEELVRSELVFCRGPIPQGVFTFKHALVRDAAYSGLLKSRRAQLHLAIAAALEQSFPEVVEAEPETLARHFAEGALVDRAVGYWLKAGRNAAKRSANVEAIAHLERGINAIRTLMSEVMTNRLELDLQLALAPCLISTQGPASGKAMATFTRARELCERLGDPPEYLQVVFWQATASVVRGELARAEEVVATLIRVAESRGEQAALLNAMRGMAMILLFMGRIVEAREAIERAFAAFEASEEADRQAARAAGQDAGVAALALMSWTYWLLGHIDRAAACIGEAIRRADNLGHPHTRAYAFYYASVVHALQGEPGVARDCADTCLTLADEHGFGHWRGLSRAIRGISTAMIDPAASSLEEVLRALEEYRSASYQLGVTVLYVLLCRALLLLHRSEAALDVIEKGIQTAERNSERIFEAELYRLKAQAIAAAGGPDADAQVSYLLERAALIAKSQGARSFELTIATDLAARWLHQGRQKAALDLLEPIHVGFSDGLDNEDLRRARALLDRLR